MTDDVREWFLARGTLFCHCESTSSLNTIPCTAGFRLLRQCVQDLMVICIVSYRVTLAGCRNKFGGLWTYAPLGSSSINWPLIYDNSVSYRGPNIGSAIRQVSAKMTTEGI